MHPKVALRTLAAIHVATRNCTVASKCAAVTSGVDASDLIGLSLTAPPPKTK